MARSTAADDAGSDESEYKAAASEDSESYEASAAPKGKPNPGGTGKKLQRKGKAGNKTDAIPAKYPPPAKKAQTPTDKVCSSHLVISLLTICIHIFLRIHTFTQHHMNSHVSLNSQTLKAKELFLAIKISISLG